ncbi:MULTISPECIES: septal ring lytic transglycosylase RlpA family protein [Rhodomicrobium]|uniref:septal ring lytic transglycosylase RlpA family protein n=1 Tax=Rhodomicrobium TaxID=1068 RepID=UPI000B4ABF7F|nr:MULTISPECIES: septal ring lytic transglycosylase RlpA family protein [Rhodomicrobium]
MFSNKSFRVCAIAFAGVCVSQTAAYAQCGTASWYHEGARTATGERYNPDGITAAHRTLPFGTKVQVRNQRTGRTVVVRINDRGPFIGGRIIDLSRGAKNVLGMDGLASVCISVLGRGETYASNEARPRRVAAAQVRKRVARAERRNVRVARAERRNVRVARAERRNVRVARAVYRTTQTSARYDDELGNGRVVRKHHRVRSAKRSQRFDGQYRQVRYQQRAQRNAFQMGSWPGTDRF